MSDQTEPPPIDPATEPLPESRSGAGVKNEVKSLKSLSSSFRHSVAKVMSQIGRAARLAALKAKIEKLKLVDLNKAHQALGAKALTLESVQIQFAEECQAISDLEERIAEKRSVIDHSEVETTGEKVQRIANQAKRKAEAEGLELKRKHLIAALGAKVAVADHPASELHEETAAVAEVSSRISDCENELTRLSLEEGKSVSWKLWLPVLAAVLIGCWAFMHLRQPHSTVREMSDVQSEEDFEIITPGLSPQQLASARGTPILAKQKVQETLRRRNYRMPHSFVAPEGDLIVSGEFPGMLVSVFGYGEQNIEMLLISWTPGMAPFSTQENEDRLVFGGSRELKEVILDLAPAKTPIFRAWVSLQLAKWIERDKPKFEARTLSNGVQYTIYCDPLKSFEMRIERPDGSSSAQ